MNDPSSTTCVRCDTALLPAVAPSRPAQPRNYDPYAPDDPYAPPGAYPPPAGAYPPPPAEAYPPPAAGYQSPPPGRSRLPLIAGLSVLILIALVAALVVIRKQANEPAAQPAPVQVVTTDPPVDPTTDPPTGPTTSSGDAQTQAAALDSVLSESVVTRAKLNTAIGKIGSCSDVAGAVDDMRAVGTERQSQIDTVTSTDLSALPTGEALRSGLITALRYSLEADQGFLGWAEPTTSNGCATTSARTRAYKAGRAASDKAQAAKSDFLAQWNPVATENGLKTRTVKDI